MTKGLHVLQGKAKGRILAFPENEKCRPTSDKVREAISAMLKPLLKPETTVLDLFAGTGALAFELMSIGVGQLTMVDHVVHSIESNVERLGWTAQCKVIRSDVARFIRTRREQSFDIVLMDPPYEELELLDATLQALARTKLVAPGGVLIIEMSTRANPTLPEGWRRIRDKTYGGTRVWLVTHAGMDPFAQPKFRVEDFT